MCDAATHQMLWYVNWSRARLLTPLRLIMIIVTVGQAGRVTQRPCRDDHQCGQPEGVPVPVPGSESRSAQSSNFQQPNREKCQPLNFSSFVQVTGMPINLNFNFKLVFNTNQSFMF